MAFFNQFFFSSFYRIIILFLARCDLMVTSNVDCDFKTSNYDGLGSVYICSARNDLNILSKDVALIESASGNHINSKQNINVMVFEADNKKTEYFPKGLEKIFENLKGIYIGKGRLKELQKSDFAGYTELLYLELENNDIQFLEDGVFDYIPNILTIWLLNVKIIHIGENVFQNLNNLRFLGFVQNTCVNVKTMDYQAYSYNTLQTLKNNCFNQDFAKFSIKLKNLEENSKTIKRDNFYIFTLTLEKLEKEFKNSRFSYLNSIKERFHNLKFVTPESIASQGSCKVSKIEELEASLKVAVTNTLDDNLKQFQQTSCAIIDERITSYNSDLDQSFSDLIKKLKNTDKNIEGMNNMWEKLVDFPTVVSKRMGKFEGDQMQFTKNEVHQMKLVMNNENAKFEKLEERMEKIEKNIEKILQALNARN